MKSRPTQDRASLDPMRTRRQVLRSGVFGAGLAVAGPWLAGCAGRASASDLPRSNIANLGPLGAPDESGVRLPAGFTCRILARSTQTVPGTDYAWHGAPDGAGVFPSDDGGWIYVVNSEIPGVEGGAGAIRFDRDGAIVDAYRILSGTNFNCAGGPTPWGTWLSCEEDFAGRGAVFECDPTGENEAVRRAALGLFTHEGVAVDPNDRHLYLTEDQPDGGFYRFAPDRYPDLAAGTLQIARVVEPNAVAAGGKSAVEWLDVPDPQATEELTRHQVSECTPFSGGEGIWYRDGVCYFSTKFDDRVYAYRTAEQTVCVFYDAARDGGVLSGVDNVTISKHGDVLVAEDGADMQIVALVPGDADCRPARVVPLVQIDGHEGSEVTGPVFDPSGTRLYFSSQRGPSGEYFTGGVTYEVRGPFAT